MLKPYLDKKSFYVEFKTKRYTFEHFIGPGCKVDFDKVENEMFDNDDFIYK